MDKKRLKKEYRETPRPMGVFLIRNIANDKVFLGAGLDLVGTMNRHKFQLTNGSHPNARLQRVWNEVGSSNFAFEIIDQITPQDDPAFDSKAELEFMEKLWLQELQPFDERGYNQRKLSRGEMLARIAAKGSDEP
jgi:hypothetical protein